MQKVLATQKTDYRYSWLHSSNWTWYKITGWQAANLIRSFAQLTADKRLLIEVCITDKSFNISYMKCISCIDNWDFNDIFAECSLWQVDNRLYIALWPLRVSCCLLICMCCRCGWWRQLWLEQVKAGEGLARRRCRGSWSLLFVYGPITLLHFTSSTSIN